MVRNKSDFIFFWDAWILLLITYSAIEIPFSIVVHYHPGTIVYLADSIVALSFIIDIFIRFRTPILKDGKYISGSKAIAKSYLKGWFTVDFLSAIPFELLLLAGGSSSVFVTLSTFRLIKVLRIVSFKPAWEYKTNLNPGIVRLGFFFYFLFLCMHWMACGWVRLRIVGPEADMLDEYMKALYWCTTTVTTIGYGDITPDHHRNIEMIYTMAAQLLGAGAYGYIIGNIATLLTNIDVAKSRHRERVDMVDNFMKSKKMPKKLQERVHNYYEYLWESRHGYNDATILSDLPESFKYEFAIQLNKGIIEKVPLFKGADHSLIDEIVLFLKPCIYTPGDPICTYGEIGDKMYFINKGSVDVTSRDGKQVYATLKDGDFFGEIALLLKQPRNATISAKEYCDLYSLSKESFDRAISNYPDFEKSIQLMARERMNSGN